MLLILFSIRTRRVVSLQILWPSQFTQIWPKRCRVRRHFDEVSCRYPRTLYHCAHAMSWHITRDLLFPPITGGIQWSSVDSYHKRSFVRSFDSTMNITRSVLLAICCFHRWPVVFTGHRWILITKGQSCGALMLPWTNCWTTKRVAGDLRRLGTYVTLLKYQHLIYTTSLYI